MCKKDVDGECSLFRTELLNTQRIVQIEDGTLTRPIKQMGIL